MSELKNGKLLQALSDQMGEHQFAEMHTQCMDCKKNFTISIERTGPETLNLFGGAIGVRRSTGETFAKCPDCIDDPQWGTNMEVYSRVVGYLRPKSNWNDAKKEEFDMRKTYTIPEEM